MAAADRAARPLSSQVIEAMPCAHPFDEHLFERAKLQWQFGEWESLAAIGRDGLAHHPERATISLLIASACIQLGEPDAARPLIHQAKAWGCSRTLMARILISGVHNSLARTAVLSGREQLATRHFRAAVQIGSPGTDVPLLARARTETQQQQLRRHAHLLANPVEGRRPEDGVITGENT
ncbi:hypothetical protein [Massilia sp. TS11]|uniref:hypothetical protein n=1 Tax=Massilia sp. TS11 TaxID=2908003 RepID=UPI001EDA2CC7|nr:hypothetical protein [Massilia sp. TS11]MCG2582825.1 hypothetical protein [Massilia sp. TS11]